MQNDTPRALTARANGAKSRGPKTAEGKAKSSQNALKHGFSAAKWIRVPDDEEGAFEKYAGGILQVLRPTDPFQDALVELIISCLWRLRRVPVLEATLIRDEVADFHSTGIKFYRHDWPQAQQALGRYSANLNHAFHKALKELKALQAEQRAAGIPAREPSTQHHAAPSPLAPPQEKTQNEPKLDDYDLDEILERVFERSREIQAERQKEGLQNEPKFVVYDAEEVTKLALQKRREIQANAAAEHPREGKKTTAEALNAFRTPKRRPRRTK